LSIAIVNQKLVAAIADRCDSKFVLEMRWREGFSIPSK